MLVDSSATRNLPTVTNHHHFVSKIEARERNEDLNGKLADDRLPKSFKRLPVVIEWTKRLSPKGSEVRMPDLPVTGDRRLSSGLLPHLTCCDHMRSHVTSIFRVQIAGSPPWYALVAMGHVLFTALMLQSCHKKDHSEMVGPRTGCIRLSVAVPYS